MNLIDPFATRMFCAAAILLAVSLAIPMPARANPGDGTDDLETADAARRKPKKEEPPEPAPLPPEVLERLDQMQAEIDALKAGKEEADLKVDELTVTMAEEKKEQKKKEEKAKTGTKVNGWYAASLTSQFGGDHPLNFAFNEVEMNVDATAADWVSFRADLQVRPEFSDPEEQAAEHLAQEQSYENSESTFENLVGNMAEQGYAKFLLHKARRLEVTTGKFNSNLGMEPFDAVDTQFLTHSMTHLHGIARTLTGARVGMNPVDTFRMEFFVADGWNTAVDTNKVPSIGAQFRLNVPGTMDASLAAYYGEDSENVQGIQQNDVPRMTANAHARLTSMEHLRVGLEVVFGQETVEKDVAGVPEDLTERWFSGYFTVDYDPLTWLTVAARGEFFWDDQGLRLPALSFEQGGYIYGGHLASKLTLADTVFLVGEFSYKGSDRQVLTGVDGDPAKNELFVGAQLYFLFGESENEAVRSLTDVLKGK
jgi:hypothetical protein